MLCFTLTPCSYMLGAARQCLVPLAALCAARLLLTCVQTDFSATSSSCRLLITSLPMNWYLVR